jgi:DNA-binding XRE family transcriptional regulator
MMFQINRRAHVLQSDKLDEVRERARERGLPLPPPQVRRAIRIASGLTQDDAAEVVGITRPAFTRWENGTREPRGRWRMAYRELLERLHDGG